MNTLGPFDYDKFKVSIKEIIDSKEFKMIIIDSDGNIISDISLSALRDALKGANNKDFSTLEADVEDLKGVLDSVGTDKIRTSVVDALPESPFNLSKVAGTALTGRDWSSDFAKLQNLDLAITALRDALLDPVLDQPILNNATIDSAGESDILNIRGAKHVDVLIYVGAPTGSPDITFHLQVIEPTSGKVIRTYDGNQLTGEGADWITVDGLTLGTHIKVTWDGTLDSSNYFSGCFVRVVAKR